LGSHGAAWKKVTMAILFCFATCSIRFNQECPPKYSDSVSKDIGFLILNLAIGTGKRVIEAGTGSGALTIALANAVGDEGKIYSYEIRPEMQKVAIENLQYTGFDSRVEFKIRDIAEGFDEKNVDAIFLDVPNAYDYLFQVRKSLKPGGFFGSILPTMNQVVLLLDAFKRESFVFVEVCEIFIRYYQTDADRFRPADRMVGHTGFSNFFQNGSKKQ
jgi:tRNA (adenine57-N1/adenine58-N1)-methyltransferase